MAIKQIRSEQVYMALRTDILAGRRPPGSRLSAAELTKELDSSVGVVREGLLRLVDHGLVELRPMQGFRVAELSPQDLQDLTAARLDIEAMVLRYSIAQGSAAWESSLVGIHHRLAITPRIGDDPQEKFTPQWGKAHGEFHQALLTGCQNRRLVAIAERLRDSAELYRRWTVVPAGHDEERDVAGEHLALLNASISRDADLAVDLLCTHIRKTDQILQLGFATIDQPHRD